jgi:pilus assembly protein CpaB
LVMAFLSGNEAKESGKSIQKEVKRVTVVISREKIPFGKPITSNQLEIQQVTIAQTGAYSDPAALVGKLPLYNIDPGTILTNKFFEPSAVASQVREGYRAFALRLDDNNASTAKIKAGDFVDIFSLFQSRNKEVEHTISRLIIPKLRVLAVGEQLVNTPETAEENQEPRAKSRKRTERAITVEVDIANVNVLALAQDQGELFVVIRNPDDEEMPDLSNYPQPKPVLQPIKQNVANKEGQININELSPVDAAYAGIAVGDVVIPGSTRNNKTTSPQKTANSNNRPRTGYASNIEVIRAGESSRERVQ